MAVKHHHSIRIAAAIASSLFLPHPYINPLTPTYHRYCRCEYFFYIPFTSIIKKNQLLWYGEKYKCREFSLHDNIY